MTDDLPFDYPSAPTVNVTTRRCRRHDWGPPTYGTVTYPVIDGKAHLPDGSMVECDPRIEKLVVPVMVDPACLRCGKAKHLATVRRGKNNRARGNAIEREIGHRLGLRRVGQYGGPDDLSGEMFAVQVKSGGSFSERYWAWLKALPVTASQTPLLVVTDAPGPGHRRRAVVVLDIEDWIALHGPEGME